MAKRRKMSQGTKNSKRQCLRSNSGEGTSLETAQEGDENSVPNSPETDIAVQSASLTSAEISCSTEASEVSSNVENEGNESIELASCSADTSLILPDEEYVFAPIVATDSDPVDLITPPVAVSFDFSQPANRVDGNVELPNNDHKNIQVEGSAQLPENFLAPSTSCARVEIIDVDKLPDPPNSPVGDDVVEILAPIEPSNHRRFVDLTDHEDITDSNTATRDDNSSPISSENNDDEVDLPNVLNTPSLREKSSTGVGEKTEVTCPICMDTVKQICDSRRKLMSTRCGHVFCDECIMKAFEAKSSSNCPKCRKKIQKKQIHPIFL